MSQEEGSSVMPMVLLVILLVLVTVGGMIGWAYGSQALKPWWAEKNGEAELRQAELNRQIAVLEAEAKMESAKHEAQAEIERARGVAEANEIIGNSLQGNEEYLRYLYIDQLSDTNNQVIYLPTEAGLPILEAKRGVQ